MKRVVWVALGVAAVVSSADALRSGAATMERVMTRAEYAAAMAALEASVSAQDATCESRAVDRDLCHAQVAAAGAVRGAEIESGFRRTAEAARGAQRARIEARYLVERARCANLAGAKKDQCYIDAHAARGRALMEAAAPYEDARS